MFGRAKEGEGKVRTKDGGKLRENQNCLLQEYCILLHKFYQSICTIQPLNLKSVHKMHFIYCIHSLKINSPNNFNPPKQPGYLPHIYRRICSARDCLWSLCTSLCLECQCRMHNKYPYNCIVKVQCTILWMRVENYTKQTPRKYLKILDSDNKPNSKLRILYILYAIWNLSEIHSHFDPVNWNEFI